MVKEEGLRKKWKSSGEIRVGSNPTPSKIFYHLPNLKKIVKKKMDLTTMTTNDYFALGYQSSIYLCFAFLFTAYILFNLSNCKKNEKDQSCIVALIFAEIALGLMAVYFMSDYYIVGLLVLFIILFPIVTKSSSGSTCPKLTTYVVLNNKDTSSGMDLISYEWVSEGIKIIFTKRDPTNTNVTPPIIIPTKNILSLSKGAKYNLVPEDYVLINCSGSELRLNVAGDLTPPIPNNNLFFGPFSEAPTSFTIDVV